MLIIEILLTASAWRRGWKGWALLPILGAVLYGIVVGMNTSGGPDHLDLGTLIIGDVVAIIALIVMNATGRKTAETPIAPTPPTDQIPQ